MTLMKNQKRCTMCNFVGKEIYHTSGSILIEIFLWACFLFPGLLYSIWRLASRKKVCPRCKHNAMIPA